MISYHIYLSVALVHKESQMEAARQAHQARSRRRLARISHPRRSFLSRITRRLGAVNHADRHAVEYEIALAPAISTPHAYRPGAATAPGQPLAEPS